MVLFLFNDLFRIIKVVIDMITKNVIVKKNCDNTNSTVKLHTYFTYFFIRKPNLST